MSYGSPPPPPGGGTPDPDEGQHGPSDQQFGVPPSPGQAQFGQTPPPPPYGQPPYGQPPYGQPAPQYGQAPPPPMYGGQPAGPKPSNYLVWSILTVLLCWPLAIPAIIFSTQVNSKWNAGDAVGAAASSRKARMFAIIATILGVIALLINVLVRLNSKS